MKKEMQVVSQELAKEMAELGFEQDSLFWWVKHIKSGTNHYTWDLVYGKDENDLINKHISAYTVVELGDLLPEHILHGVMPTPYYLIINKSVYEEGVEWHVKYRNESICDTFCSVKANSETDARGKMCILLRKRKETANV